MAEPAAPARDRVGLALTLATFAALAVLPLVPDLVGGTATVTLFARMILYAIAAVSLNLILGYGGLVSFGHAAYLGLGGYTVGILYAHFVSGDPFLGLVPGTNLLLVTVPAAMLVSGLFALAIGALSLRTSGVQFIMITLAFAQMVFFLFVSLKVYGGDDGLSIRRPNVLFDLNLRDTTTMYYVGLVALVAYTLLVARIVRSRFGRVLTGLRQNERRMAAIGVSTYRYKLVAFVIAGMGAGLSGALMANLQRFVSPDLMKWSTSGELMIMVILGGAGSLVGPIWGAIALVGMETALAGWTEHWQVWLGPILIGIVLFARGGLHGFVASLLRRDGR